MNHIFANHQSESTQVGRHNASCHWRGTARHGLTSLNLENFIFKRGTVDVFIPIPNVRLTKVKKKKRKIE